MIEQHDAHTVAENFGGSEAAWQGQRDENGGTLLEALSDALSLILESEQHSSYTHTTYTLHVECARLLLVLFGTQLTQPLSSDAYNPFLSYMMSRKADARRLTAALLRYDFLFACVPEA